MLKRVQVNSPWRPSDDFWTVDVANRPMPSGAHWPGERCEIRNIDGLGSPAAAINTSPLGSVDGESFLGSNVGKRNIVFTIGFTPDWVDYTPGALRKELNRYFTPKLFITMTFETFEFAPVEISGYVESNEPNIFSSDPEHVISVVCPDPYFTSVDPTLKTGNIGTGINAAAIDYEGDVETGMVVSVFARAPALVQPDWVRIAVNDPLENFIELAGDGGGHILESNQDLILSSVSRDKYISLIDSEGNFYANLLNRATIFDFNDRDTRWPVIGPATDSFIITSNVATKAGYVAGSGYDPTYELRYHNRFGSL